jgi:hypothetical protein
MGEESEKTMKEIEELRDDLGEKVDALAGKFKEGAEGAKKKGLAVIGIAAAAILGIVTLKRFRKNK